VLSAYALLYVSIIVILDIAIWPASAVNNCSIVFPEKLESRIGISISQSKYVSTAIPGFARTIFP